MSDVNPVSWSATGDVPTARARVVGEVDFSNSQDVRDWLKAFAARTSGEFVLDLSALEYIDSSGLAVLIEIRKLLRAEGRSIRIDAVSSQVHKLFSLTQIGELFGL